MGLRNPSNRGAGNASGQRPFDELLATAHAGDAAAVAQLVDQYRPYLLLIANEDLDEAIKTKAAASDVVQETMMHAQTGFTRFSGTTEAEFRGWLRSILKHDLSKTQRRYQTQKRNSKQEVNLQEQSAVGRSLVDPTLTPSSHAVSNEKTSLIATAFESLSTDHQQVIQLRNFDGLSFEEVGDQMNRSADASRKLWARAIDALRKSMESIAPEMGDVDDMDRQ